MTDAPFRGEQPRSVQPAARLRGEPRLPGDKSISHRALIMAALAEGRSLISGAGDGRDVQATAGIMAALGASVARVREDGLNVDYSVTSPGVDGLHESEAILDCRNSGTSLRLCSGLLAGLPFFSALGGLLKERPLDDWKVYLRWTTVRGAAPFLNAAVEQEWFPSLHWS